MIVNLTIAFVDYFLQEIAQMSCLCACTVFVFYTCMCPPSLMITMVFLYVKTQPWRTPFNHFTFFLLYSL
jgi:hypothetical protein